MNPFARLTARALLGGGLVVVLLAALPLAAGPDDPGLLLLVTYPPLLLYVVVLARRRGVELRRVMGGPVPADRAVAVLALVPALVAFGIGLIWLVFTPLSYLTPDAVRAWLERMDDIFPANLTDRQELLLQAGAILVAPVVEEVLFRGLLLHRWSYRFGPIRGLVLSSAAFGLMHPSPVNALVLGLAFGLIYLSSGSLWLTIAAHALNNLLALTVLPLVSPEGASAGVDALTSFRTGSLQALVMFAGGGVILWLGRRWYWPADGVPLPYYRTGLSSASGGQAAAPAVAGNPAGPETIQEGMMQTPAGPHEIATLAGGCFWCLEAAFQQLQGVERVTSGYAGGTVDEPSYEAVCSGTTGHAEVVQIEFDPSVIGFRDLLEVFFAIHDPTTLNRQGADVGTQYRSAIFHHTPEQRAAAEAVIAQYNAERLWGAPIVTEVVPLTRFYPAEAYHRDYFARNPYQPYCMAVVAPKVAKVRAKYAGRLKKVS